METCINYCEPGWAFFSSDEHRWINHIRKLTEEYPGECIILKQPEENGGFIYAKFPQKWARVKPPRKDTLSDSERAKRRELLDIIRQTRLNKSNGEPGDDGSQ